MLPIYPWKAALRQNDYLKAPFFFIFPELHPARALLLPGCPRCHPQPQQRTWCHWTRLSLLASPLLLWMWFGDAASAGCLGKGEAAGREISIPSDHQKTPAEAGSIQHEGDRDILWPHRATPAQLPTDQEHRRFSRPCPGTQRPPFAAPD